MELSMFMARLIGLMYLAIGIGFISDKAYYQRMYKRIADDQVSFITFGLFALIAGFALVTYHNIWVADWPVVITIIGWGGLIKGLFLLIFPKSMMALTNSIAKNETFIGMVGVFALILGLVMGYFGFVAA